MIYKQCNNSDKFPKKYKKTGNTGLFKCDYIPNQSFNFLYVILVFTLKIK